MEYELFGRFEIIYQNWGDFFSYFGNVQFDKHIMGLIVRAVIAFYANDI